MKKKLPITAPIMAIITVFALIFTDGTDIRSYAMTDFESIKVNFSCESSDKGVRVKIDDMKPGKNYEVSVSGGKAFTPVTSEAGVLFTSLGKGDFQVCARVAGEPRTVSDITVASTAEKDEEIYIKCCGLRENTYKGGGLRVEVQDYSPDETYVLIVNGGEKRAVIKDGVGEVTGLTSDYYRVQVQRGGKNAALSRSTVVYVPYKANEGGALLRKIPAVRQNPELPTGCEVTSLSMALRYLGINVDKEILADNYLPKCPYRTGDYRKAFVGDPRSTFAYGCYSEVIEKCAKQFLSVQQGRKFDVVNITGCDPDRLYACLEMGYPVIVWVTIDMQDTFEGASWVDEDTGQNITWRGNEHCVLLTGYSASRDTVYLNDPLKGSVGCSKEIFEQRFKEMESQAVFIAEVDE
ncbi:MAG: C39 family peptidase [Oscillospiraceae bacterium]|nr:C39 family peptidase [Oscillospiraceae bacterium]